jgi:hypothetical protein
MNIAFGLFYALYSNRNHRRVPASRADAPCADPLSPVCLWLANSGRWLCHDYFKFFLPVVDLHELLIREATKTGCAMVILVPGIPYSWKYFQVSTASFLFSFIVVPLFWRDEVIGGLLKVNCRCRLSTRILDLFLASLVHAVFACDP